MDQQTSQPTSQHAPFRCCTHHTSGHRKQFLGLGIISFVDRVPGFSLTSKEIQEMIDEEAKELESIGVDHTMFEVNPDDSNLMELMKEKLKSQQWDGIIIGWGVRGTMNLTSIFEVAVNLSVQEAIGAKLMFPTSPGTVVESARRVFPELRTKV